MLTFITCTKRQDPKFEWLFESLANSWAHAGKPSAEWLIVDGCLWDDPERSAKISDLALTFSVPSVVHLTPKPTVWQGPARLTKQDYWALNNARNTGIIHASGDHLVLFDDCMVVDCNFVARHAAAEARKIALCGSFKSYTTATVVKGNIEQGDLHPIGTDSRGTTMQRGYGSWAWGLNFSVPLVYAVMANGYDEMYDGQAGSDDCDFGVRLERLRCPLVFDPSCLVYQVLTTHEAVGGHAGWGTQDKISPKELQLKTGRIAFANEKLIEKLVEDPFRFLPLHTWTDIKSARNTGIPGAIADQPAVDWRDGQPLAEM